MTDLEVALGIAAFVAVIFSWALFGQRRQPGAVAAEPEGASGRVMTLLASFETRMTTEMAAIKGRQQHNDHDVNNIRTMLGALPSKDAVHRLEVELTKVAGRVETVDTGMLAMQRSIDRIETFLLSRAKERHEL